MMGKIGLKGLSGMRMGSHVQVFTFGVVVAMQIRSRQTHSQRTLSTEKFLFGQSSFVNGQPGSTIISGSGLGSGGQITISGTGSGGQTSQGSGLCGNMAISGS